MTMTATSMSGQNVWKEMASERERYARIMTLVSAVLGFALIATISYSYASVSKYSGLCDQIETFGTSGISGVKEIARNLSDSYCS
jgi:uncharacterized membrane protein (DUF485 family)